MKLRVPASWWGPREDAQKSKWQTYFVYFTVCIITGGQTELRLGPPKHTLDLSPTSLLRHSHSFVCLAQPSVQQHLGRE